MRRRVIVLLGGPLDGLLHHPFTSVLVWLVRLTGTTTHRLARLYCALTIIFGFGFAVAGGGWLFDAVMSSTVGAWGVMTWRLTIPRWERRMADFSEGYIEVRLPRDLSHMALMRLLFGSMSLSAVAILATDAFVAPEAMFAQSLWAAYSLCATAMYFSCTTAIDPGRSAKDWAKDKAKALRESMRRPVLIPAPVGA